MIDRASFEDSMFSSLGSSVSEVESSVSVSGGFVESVDSVSLPGYPPGVLLSAVLPVVSLDEFCVALLDAGPELLLAVSVVAPVYRVDSD